MPGEFVCIFTVKYCSFCLDFFIFMRKLLYLISIFLGEPRPQVVLGWRRGSCAAGRSRRGRGIGPGGALGATQLVAWATFKKGQMGFFSSFSTPHFWVMKIQVRLQIMPVAQSTSRQAGKDGGLPSAAPPWQVGWRVGTAWFARETA